jgi:hypothetical protein
MKDTHYVYKMTDPITGEYYIGVRSCESQAEEDRTYRGSMRHWKLTKDQKTALDKTILQTFSSRKAAEEYEIELIFQAKVAKDLLNRNAYIPSKGFSMYGVTMSEEARKKISESQKGNKWMLGKTRSEETRKKIGEGNRGKIYSEESRKKISEANRGKKHSEETRKKFSQAKLGKKGKPHSEEARKKISDGSRVAWERRRNAGQ